MPFITKLDFSSNRQIRQTPETFTVLSGGTQFGMPYSALTTGPDLTTTGVTLTLTNLVSTFSGNSGTTIYTWYDPIMAIAEPYLSAITPSTSAITQNTGLIMTVDSTGTTIDGYTYAITYSGLSFDLVGLAMISLGGGNYSGSVHTNTLDYYSATSLDYSGRTIWVDVSGITRTQDLIITNAPQVGFIWACIDSEGKGAWTDAAALSASSCYWSASTGPNSLVMKNSNSSASGLYTVVIGSGLTGSKDNHTYVGSLNVNSVASSAFVNDIRIDASGYLTTNTSDERLKENIEPLTNALETIKKLNGVTYQWKDRNSGGDDIRIGFIAQQVEAVDSRLSFTNKVDGYKGVHIDSIIPLLVEAVKEIAVGGVSTGNTYLETQSIIAEDNNIDLNYGGNQQTAVGGGIRVLHAFGEDNSADLLIDENGNWVTNNEFAPNGLVVPIFTPISSEDNNGIEGNITRDENFLYIKTKDGWKRSNLESF